MLRLGHIHSLVNKKIQKSKKKKKVSSEETSVLQMFCFMFSGSGCCPVNNGLNHTRK